MEQYRMSIVYSTPLKPCFLHDFQYRVLAGYQGKIRYVRTYKIEYFWRRTKNKVSRTFMDSCKYTSNNYARKKDVPTIAPTLGFSGDCRHEQHGTAPKHVELQSFGTNNGHSILGAGRAEQRSRKSASRLISLFSDFRLIPYGVLRHELTRTEPRLLLSSLKTFAASKLQSIRPLWCSTRRPMGEQNAPARR